MTDLLPKTNGERTPTISPNTWNTGIGQHNILFASIKPDTAVSK